MTLDLRASTGLAFEGPGYPSRLMTMFAATLAMGVIGLVLPCGHALIGTLLATVTLLALAAISVRLAHARSQGAHVMAGLGAATADLPVSLRTEMPLVLVLGDALADLFNRTGEAERFAHLGDGAIWLRVERPEDLPRLASAVKLWRNGRAPDGVVLAVAPALHEGEHALKEMLRLARQAVADTLRVLGSPLPGYVAVYQQLTANAPANEAPPWYGFSSAARLDDAQCFEAVIRQAESESQQMPGNPVQAARAARLASLISWTQRAVIDPLVDRQLPVKPLTLYGAAWIDCGPALSPSSPWLCEVAIRTQIRPQVWPASLSPWPLPQQLIDSLPMRAWISPRKAALAHAIALLAIAGALATWEAASNNQRMLSRIGAELSRFSAIPSKHDEARREALRALVAERDQLARYARTGVPLRLSFGMYRGAPLKPAIDNAIASYRVPPAVVTLDSMSLFDSGKSVLKPGSTHALISALDMIKLHPDKRILVAGHTDQVGRADTNQRLSLARAGAVRDWLIDASGMSATRFAIQGYGDTRPSATNDTEVGRATNRRVEITLVVDSSAAPGQ